MSAREVTVDGPYQYDGDLHACFRVESEAGLLACVYAYDDDIEAARSLAYRMAIAARAEWHTLAATLRALGSRP